MPLSVKPDHLTSIGLVGAFLAAIFFPLTNVSVHYVWLGIFGLVLNWFGDSLDGTVARLRMIERPRHGLFIDHTADLISQVLIGIGFGLMPFIALSSVLLVLTSYLVFVAHTFIRALVFKQITIAYFSVGPTEVRTMLIVVSLLMAYVPAVSRPVLGDLASSDLVAIALATSGYIGFLVQAYRDWRALLREPADL